MHHLTRLRPFPWNVQTSVADYIVLEGKAESFAASRFGDKHIGRFVTDISAADLGSACSMIGGALEKTGFDTIRGYLLEMRWLSKAALHRSAAYPHMLGTRWAIM